MNMGTGYADFVAIHASRNSSMRGLHRFLQDKDGKQVHPVTIVTIDVSDEKTRFANRFNISPWDDIHTHGTPSPSMVQVEPKLRSRTRTQKLQEIATIPSGVRGRIILVEDIDRNTVCHLGEAYNIAPLFFATYLDTDFVNLEARSSSPSHAIASSQTVQHNSMHLHCQRLIQLEGNSDQSTQTLKVYGNVQRSAKQTPALSNCHLALARTCTSVIFIDIEPEKWICLILVDPINGELISQHKSDRPFIRQKLFGGEIEYPLISPDFSTWKKFVEARSSEQTTPKEAPRIEHWEQQRGQSFLDCISQHLLFENALLGVKSPSVLEFAYYPAQLMMSEWLRYTLLLSRYVKHYEYALISPSLSFKQSKIEELLPWRRRCTRSLQKLEVFRMSIDHQVRKSGRPMEERWEYILKDVDHISSQITHWAGFLNSMVPLLDTHQSLIEAQNVRRLTYSVLAFASFSLVASILSMSEHVLPWGGEMWIYFAIAVPLTIVVLFAYLLVPKLLSH